MLDASYALLVDWNGDDDFADAGEDCSADFVRANVVRGFAGPLARVATVGRGTFLLNNISRQYSPAVHAGIRPGAAVLFKMTYNAVTETLFAGHLETIEPASGPYGERRVRFACADNMARIDGVEARILLTRNVRADQVIRKVTDAIGTLPAPDYEAGINVFATSADRWTHDPTGGVNFKGVRYWERGNAAGKILDAAAADWGRFFVAGDGVPTFYNRHHMALDATTELTLTTPTELGYRMGMSEVYNIVEVRCSPRSVGAFYSTVWQHSSDEAPMIDPGVTRTMDCKFTDPDNEAVTIGAAYCLTPVANTDFTATSDQIGDGDDKTAQVGMVATFYGDRATLEITNNDAKAIYIQTLRIRGTPIRSTAPWTAIEEDATSQTAYGARRLSMDAILLSRAYEAERLAEYLVDVYKDPADEITGVRFCANTSATLMEAARDLELCDRVVLTEFQTGLSADAGHIYGLQHNIGEAGHWVSMDIETAYDPGTPFRLETAPPGGGSALNSGHVLIY